MRNQIKALPNYDAQVFYEITGLDWSEEGKKQPKD